MVNQVRLEYAFRLNERRKSLRRLEQWHNRIGISRFVLFIALAVMAWLATVPALLSPGWTLLPLCCFFALVFVQESIQKKRTRLERSIDYYGRGLSRLEGSWAGTGEQGLHFLSKHHPYANDLDLFGHGSLFELLCAARTRAGEETLASWLKQPGTREEIIARQQAVEELRNKLDLREDLAVIGTDVRAGLEPEALIEWGTEKPLPIPRWYRWLAVVLGILALTGLIFWLSDVVRYTTFLGLVLLELLFFGHVRQRVGQIIEAVDKPSTDLPLLAQILSRLEREKFVTPLLIKLRADLESQRRPPSKQIARLNWLVVLLDSRRNLIFGPFAALLLWGTRYAFAIERWRRIVGPSVSRWVAAVGTMEALCSIAGYAYENHDDPFPDIVTEGGTFDGEDLGHPLITTNRCVRNDVRLSETKQLMLVSGSNMSGKSTLLRTVGINAVLALAGAPVRAGRLRLSILAVGASIRIVDSLQSGSSRFYAEITRLRQLVELTKGENRLLFLLDELLHGTNSHDRRIGAEAIARDLIRRGAIGLLTTHDLALAHIAEELKPLAQNVHFADHLENGKMVFDYRLRSGVVKKSNALELMRSIGLEV